MFTPLASETSTASEETSSIKIVNGVTEESSSVSNLILSILTASGAVSESVLIQDQSSATGNFSITLLESLTVSDPAFTNIVGNSGISENISAADRIFARFIWELIIDPNTEDWVLVPVGPSENWAQIATAGGAWTTIDNGTQESWTDKISPQDSSWKTIQ